MKALSVACFFLSLSSLANTIPLAEKLENIRSRYDLPGIAATFSKAGDISHFAAAGVRKISDPALMTAQDKIHLGSCGKSMTATVVGTFVEEGKLHWDDSLETIFPAMAIHDDFKKVTVGDLLAHRSGLLSNPSRDLRIELEQYSPTEGRKRLAEYYLSRKPSLSPRAQYSYSNVGYTIIGAILEKISSKTFEMLLSERVFSPLAMHSCSFGATSEPESSFVNQPWGHYRDGNVLKAFHGDNAPFANPAGNYHCSMPDWHKFLQAQMKGFHGEDNLLKASTYKKLHTPYPAENESYTYGGWFRVERKWARGSVLTHSGSNTLASAEVWVAPELDSIVMVGVNLSDDSSKRAVYEVVDEWILNYLPVP